MYNDVTMMHRAFLGAFGWKKEERSVESLSCKESPACQYLSDIPQHTQGDTELQLID